MMSLYTDYDVPTEKNWALADLIRGLLKPIIYAESKRGANLRDVGFVIHSEIAQLIAECRLRRGVDAVKAKEKCRRAKSH